MSVPVNPVTIDPQYTLTHTFFTPAGFGQGSAPFRTSPTELWLPLISLLGAPSAEPIVMFRSADNGATWAAVDALNGAHDTTGSGAGLFWDGARYLWAVDNDFVTSFLQLKKFDTQTGLWTASFAIGGPQVSYSHQLFVRSDGQIAVLYVNGSGPSHNQCVIWDGIVWAAPTTFDDNAPSVFTSMAACMDSLDRIHVLGCDSVGTQTCYQRINADGSLGPFLNLQANGLMFFHINPPQNYSICLDPTETSVVIGATTGAYGVGCSPCLLTGTPLAGLGVVGNWTLGPALEATTFSLYPLVGFDGTNPALIYQHVDNATHEPTDQHIAANSPLVFADITTVIPPHLLFPVLRVSATEMLGAYGGWDGDGVNFWRVNLPLSPIVPVIPPTFFQLNPDRFPSIPLPDPAKKCR